MKKSKDPLLDKLERRSEKWFSAASQFNKTLDRLLEGIQIIDFNWRYVYVNNTQIEYEKTTKEELLGRSMLERYPNANHSEFFRALEHCMFERKVQRMETLLVYPDQSKKWLQVNIEPVDEGVLVLSLDITKRKEADDKIKRANHLYSFISQVNQNIVRVKDEATLFRNACRMALEFGGFKIAWIGLFDKVNNKITLADQCGVSAEEMQLFLEVPFGPKGPQNDVLHSGTYYVCNDIEHALELKYWWPYALTHGIRSYMILPIKKSGNVVGTFNLYATELDFAAQEEIDLLVEVTTDISFALDLLEKDRRHNAAEELNINNEKRFRHTLDSMLEGIQIHDFNWHYIYVNNALVSHSTYSREDLLGFTIQEKYPGIERTRLFEVMQRCLYMREGENLETEFIFPNGTKAYFELSVQPIPEGIFILSVDRTEQKKSNDKLLKVNRLYAFISAINQSIVHISHEQVLLNNTCQVAVDIGQFKLALIDMVDEQSGRLKRISMRSAEVAVRASQAPSATEYDYFLFSNMAIESVFNTGKYWVSNDVQNDPTVGRWKSDLETNEIKASISLPILRAGKVVGVFGLHSPTENFFDEEEIRLLEEATGDISFALENYDKEEKHKVTEELVIKNELRFRALIEKSADMITLVTEEGELIYGSPSITQVLGYTVGELMHKRDYEFIHPDDIPSFRKHKVALLQNPWGSSSSQQRLLHTNGNWIWCEGTVTNLLHQPGVHAIVSNFRDISEKKSLEQQRDFNKNNLNALINNTTDLMWSVDKDFNLITSNQPFDEMIKRNSGVVVEKGSSILYAGFSHDQSNRFKTFYERAFGGEAFTEIEYTRYPEEAWSEISYYPILREHEVIGTACHSRNISERKQTEKKLIQYNEELRKTNLELDRFVYSTSHDLRAPLCSVLGLVSLLVLESKEVSTLEYARMIRISINRLDSFIKNVLSYSKNNRLEMQVNHIPVQKTIGDIVNSLRNMSEAEGVSFEIDIDEQRLFYSDVHRFTIIMENLISNAIKFQDYSRTDRFIKITGKLGSENLSLQIADNGIGITEEYQNKIFDMFFRISGERSGSGIGLYIVKETITKLQGSITVDSREHVGTTFNVQLKNMTLEVGKKPG